MDKYIPKREGINNFIMNVNLKMCLQELGHHVIVSKQLSPRGRRSYLVYQARPSSLLHAHNLPCNAAMFTMLYIVNPPIIQQGR